MSDYSQFENKMKKTCEALSTQLATLRAGRANASVLDQIQVDYYGSPTPIQQVASIATQIHAPCSYSPGTAPCSRASKRPSWPPTWDSTPRTTGV